MKDARARVKSWLLFFLRVQIYISLATIANIRSFWSWLVEPQGFLCDRPSRGAAPNKTKMKVLFYGMAKTGTTASTDLIGKIYENTWHSGEFLLHVWAPLADKFWSKKENGGSIWFMDRLATPSAPAYKGHSLWPRKNHGSDKIVQNGLDPGELAQALEKCHADSMTFDGMDELFWTVYDISPEAKVIFLNWRDHKAWVRSAKNFVEMRALTLIIWNFLVVGQHFLPWNALLLPLADHFFPGDIMEVMRGGKRIKEFRKVSGALVRQAMIERRMLQHHLSGLVVPIKNEFDYNQYWYRGKEIIPKERRAELNMLKHSPADFCRMLGVTDKPICNDTGNIPNIKPLLNYERKMVNALLGIGPWFIVLHCVNHTLAWTLVYWIAGKLSQIVCGCAALLGWNLKKSKHS